MNKFGLIFVSVKYKVLDFGKEVNPEMQRIKYVAMYSHQRYKNHNNIDT
jgi:hypothetical protein